jgi:diguanylate cyclase (GGDEF)-like protein
VLKQKTSLRQGIVLLCAGLVLVTSVVIQGWSWWSSSQFNKRQLAESIDNAQNVFEQYTKEKEKLLTTAARVLTADFGFKQAVTTRDAETITSVLLNHGQRIDADLMLLTDLQGQLISSSLSGFTLDARQTTSLNLLLNEPSKTRFLILQNTLYQLIALSVNAPRPIAYTIVGFEINSEVADELKLLTGLDISFFDDIDSVITSSLNVTDATLTPDYLTSKTLPWLFGSRPAFDNRQIEIDTTKKHPIKLFLTADLSSTYEEYDSLLLSITVIASLIMLAAILLSGLFAKNLTKPLYQLVDLSKAFSKGQYANIATDTKMSQELSTLFDAFSEMGNAIDTRENQILYQSQHDTLTGLYNRHTFRQVINNTLVNEHQHLLVAINIRGFSNLNDILGIQIGDRCLKALAQRLIDINKEGWQHARLDGDVFLSLIPLVENVHADRCVQDFLTTLAKPLKVDSLELNLKFWAGISIYPQDGDDPKAIFRRTMIALDYAEKDNKPIRYYHTGEEEARLEHLSIIEALRRALSLDDGQLYMNYQPKLNLKTCKIDKVEALIRWKHPELGFISPEVFISYAEQTGIIFDLTAWVIDTVLKQLSDWQQKGIFIDAAINISAQDISHPDFHMNLKKASIKHQISPEYITLEVTERDLMQDEVQAIALLIELKEKGYTISVDDYGIGQSSLAKLKQLPVDELKIDKSFIMELNSSESDQIIVGSTISLGHRLGLSVVAEGLENNESLDILKNMGCDHIQGYFLSRPMTSEAFIEWLGSYYQEHV